MTVPQLRLSWPPQLSCALNVSRTWFRPETQLNSIVFNQWRCDDWRGCEDSNRLPGGQRRGYKAGSLRLTRPCLATLSLEVILAAI